MNETSPAPLRTSRTTLQSGLGVFQGTGGRARGGGGSVRWADARLVGRGGRVQDGQVAGGGPRAEVETQLGVLERGFDVRGVGVGDLTI